MDKPVEGEFKQLLMKLHKTVFKPKGYKKTGSNFRLYHSSGLCKIVNFQRSQFNDSGECRFTINLGLYFQRDPAQPCLMFKDYECQVRSRVAGVSPRYTRGKWWIITEATDHDRLYSELFALLTEDVIPWLDRFDSKESVIKAQQTGALQGAIWVRI